MKLETSDIQAACSSEAQAAHTQVFVPHLAGVWYRLDHINIGSDSAYLV